MTRVVRMPAAVRAIELPRRFDRSAKISIPSGRGLPEPMWPDYVDLADANIRPRRMRSHSVPSPMEDL